MSVILGDTSRLDPLVLLRARLARLDAQRIGALARGDMDTVARCEDRCIRCELLLGQLVAWREAQRAARRA